MCLIIDEEKTAQLRRTHPRVMKWTKRINVSSKGIVSSPFMHRFRWSPGWTESKGDLCIETENLGGLHEVRGGVIHVYEFNLKMPHPTPFFKSGFTAYVPAYGLRDDFIAAGTFYYGGGYASACYKKIYIPKAAWRNIVEPQIRLVKRGEPFRLRRKGFNQRFTESYYRSR